jgi:hypothetical protein
MYIPKSKKRFESEFGGRVSIDKGVSYQHLFGFLYQYSFHANNYSTNPVSGYGYGFDVEIAYVFMPLGFVVATLVFVDTQVEFGFVLNDG